MSAPIWRRVVHVSGVATELLGIQATEGLAKLQVLFVPGNPGSAQFYATHMQLLHRAMGGHVDVMAVSHAGHDPAVNAAYAAHGSKIWSLQDQIQHKADFIRQYMLLPGRPPLVVAGHSIGAYMAVHAVAYVESDPVFVTSEAARPPILKVLALFPFFSMDRAQWRIRFLRLAASMYEVMGRVAQALSVLPPWLQMAVIRQVASSMDPGAVRVTAQLLQRSSVRNYLYMAHTEFQELDVPPPFHLLRGLGRRLHVLGCPEDIWMSEVQYQEVKMQLPSSQAMWVEDVRHAYCTSLAQCTRVNGIMVGILSHSLVQHQQRWRPQSALLLDGSGREAQAAGAAEVEREVELAAEERALEGRGTEDRDVDLEVRIRAAPANSKM